VARELGEVLHYFLDDAPPQREPAAPPVLAVGLGRRDVLRAAFAWNLAEELARAGVRTTVVTPPLRGGEAIWPEDRGGARRRPALVEGPAGLDRAVGDARRAGTAGGGGLVMVPLPYEALLDGARPAWLAWLLLFTTPDPRERAATAALLRRLPGEDEGLRVGVTVHGVGGVDEARRAFLELAGEVERDGRRRLWSYGLLVDDLDVYRAITERTVVGEVRPACRAARAIRDVAAWIRTDLATPAHA
jgi:hypothetical protein